MYDEQELRRIMKRAANEIGRVLAESPSDMDVWIHIHNSGPGGFKVSMQIETNRVMDLTDETVNAMAD